jgi:hypothetical protein
MVRPVFLFNALYGNQTGHAAFHALGFDRESIDLSPECQIQLLLPRSFCAQDFVDSENSV